MVGINERLREYDKDDLVFFAEKGWRLFLDSLDFEDIDEEFHVEDFFEFAGSLGGYYYMLCQDAATADHLTKDYEPEVLAEAVKQHPQFGKRIFSEVPEDAYEKAEVVEKNKELEEETDQLKTALEELSEEGVKSVKEYSVEELRELCQAGAIPESLAEDMLLIEQSREGTRKTAVNALEDYLGLVTEPFEGKDD